MTHTIQRLAVRSLALFLFAGTVAAQQTNPLPTGGSWILYLVPGMVPPATMLPAAINGPGYVTVDVGNTRSTVTVLVLKQPNFT